MHVQRHQRAQGRLHHAFLLSGLLFLTGCANGDFGEIKPSLVRDDIHDWLGPEAVAGRSAIASSFNLTDDERLLRDLAYPLIEPPYDRQRFYSILGEYGAIRPDHPNEFNVTKYTDRLFSDERYRSPSAQYAKVIEDIRNDNERMPQFFATAWRVQDMDAKRRKALAYVPASSNERANAQRRMRENADLTKWVEISLRQRAQSYHFALERLVIMSPSPTAVEVERQLVNLQARIEQRPGFVPQQPQRGVYAKNSL